MYMVSASPKRLHIIAAKTTGIAEKNIIQQENGILDLHRNAVYCGNGDRNNKLPHIKFEGKLIYVLGYDNKDKWENVLGSQFGCVYIDEINTADIDFVREIFTRNDYLLATLNPDDPSLPVYQEFVNRSRPCAKYAADVPEEILRELTEDPVIGWRYWFFSFRDNLSLTEADIQRKMDAAPKGTKLYKNKILGLRGRATGLVFDLQQRHIITAAQAAEHRFLYYSIGCDTSYSRQSHDRLAFEAVGITADKKCILLLEETHNNRDKTNPFAPSDVIPLLNRFAEQVKCRYGFARTIYIDSADAGTIQEAQKPKAAKAKAHTEGVPAGHAVEVTPPATKDNGGIGKTYSLEKIGGKSLTSEDSGGIIKAEYKRFHTGEEVNDFFYYDSQEKRSLLQKKKSTYGRWKSSIASDQESAISDYCADGYDAVNSFLRKNNGYESISEEYAKSIILDLDSAIGNFDVRENFVTYRGSSIESILKEFPEAEDFKDLVGRTYHDNAYMSTSPIKKVAEKFATQNGQEGIVLEISVPKGKGLGGYINEFSGFKDNEYEFLLKRGTFLEIYEIDESGNIPILKCRWKE